MEQEDIVVVGAGPAGLATSACLRQMCVPHTLLEREAQVAPSWRRHYERLHLHTDKRYSALPFAPWPESTPRYPSREQVVEYLARYATQHAVAPRLGPNRMIETLGRIPMLDIGTAAQIKAGRIRVRPRWSRCCPVRCVSPEALWRRVRDPWPLLRGISQPEHRGAARDRAGGAAGGGGHPGKGLTHGTATS